MVTRIDPKIIQIVDAKLRSESIICSTVYIDFYVRKNDAKILPTLAAIKADLHSQWSKLEDSGRISVILEEQDMQVRRNPDGAFRNMMLAVLEQEERDLQDLAERGWDSSLGVRIICSPMYKTQANRQEFFDYKLSEHLFREKRAGVYAEFRDQGLSAAELETAILEWEMEENQNLKSCNAPANETPNQRSARLTRLNLYRHRVRGGVGIEEERELDEMRAAHGMPTVLPPTFIRQNTAGTSTATPTTSAKPNVPSASGTTSTAAKTTGEKPVEPTAPGTFSTATKTSSAKPIEPTAARTTSTVETPTEDPIEPTTTDTISADGVGMAARLRKKLLQMEKRRLANPSEYAYDWSPSTYKDPISEEELRRGIGNGFVDNET
jgi:hypothetical protein